MSRRPAALVTGLLACLALAGCGDGPSGGPSDGSPGGTQAPRPSLLNATLDLQVGPPLDDAVPGIVFGYDDCGAIRPAREGESTAIVGGNVTLEWDDSDGLRMNLSLRAERGAVTQHVPAGPSPLVLALRGIQVEWTAGVILAPGVALPPGETQRPAQMALSLSYHGDEPAVLTTNC